MKKYTYEDFLDIIKMLRSENGCPWDREQTHMSLRPYMLEEAAEAMAGIRIFDQTGDPDNMMEELGDVLLQVVLHAQIGSEEGLFTMEDVVNNIAAKMVRRHPHVFSDASVENSDEVLVNWEEIKKKEKEGKTLEVGPLREIPVELPSLSRATKTLKKLDKHYGVSGSFEEDVKKLKDAVTTLESLEGTMQDDELEKQVATILMAISDINRICKINGEQVLSDQVDKLIDDYEKLQ